MFSRPSARVAYFLGMLVVFALTEAWLPPRFSQFLNGNWAGDLVFGGMLLTFVGTTGPSPDRDALWVVPLYLGALTAIDVACHRGGVPMAWEWVAIAGVVVGIGLIQRLRGRRVLPAFTGTRWLSPPGQR